MASTFSEALSRTPLKTFSVVTFAICMLVLTVDGVDAQLLGIIAPKVIADFGVDRGTFGVAMSSALVGFGLGSWGGGWLGDKLGRRWSLAIAAALFSLATIAASWSSGGQTIAIWPLKAPQGVWELAFWRLIGGLGFGSAYANAIALAGEWLPDRWRSVGVTTLSVGTPAGGFVVAAVAPSLIEAYGWRGTFVALGAATLLVVVLIIALLRDSPSFLLARGKAEEARLAARRVLDGDIDLAPDHRDREGAVGVLHRSNLRLNIGIGLSFTAAALVAYSILSWTTTMLTAQGFTFEDAAYAVSVGGITSVVASIAAGFLAHWIGTRLLVFGLSGTLLASLVWLGAVIEAMPAAPDQSTRMLVVGLVGLTAALFSAAMATMYAIMTHAYPPSCRSSGIGFGIFMGRVGAVAATAFGGWLLDLGQGSVAPFFAVIGAGAVLFSAAGFIVDRHVPPARRAR
ncbi:MAG: MFS transporter [Candidatus Andeanibacterium colombiense]|uniref:MFS transporter n=1 Tax=Candidatus Andeanibacterium colombiense TaxID=3121345 RepID=A0AAJ5X4X6_9SPHN|nr:MAG: MFS transporter [Sphingomonadaceae bacterium]